MSHERCPHCGVAKPLIVNHGSPDETQNFSAQNRRYWYRYSCRSCGGVILTESTAVNGVVERMWPEDDVLSESIPDRARAFLKQAIDSLHAPSGAQVLAASSVDAMLKRRGYKEGTLNTRIKAAETDRLITPEMALWAHEVRLDANDQRHADEDAPLPTRGDAEKTIEFAKALAQFLFVLPAMVSRGRGLPGTNPPTPATVTSSEPPTSPTVD